MGADLDQLFTIFDRNQANIKAFMDKLSPVIATATDEHKRLYFHHIYEEEEQHLDRLAKFLPRLSNYIQSVHDPDVTNPAFITLLQDINLERFGLHNFLEHIDLSLYEFKDDESQARLGSMLEQTKSDYLLAKEILAQINEQFLPDKNHESPSDHHQVLSAAHDHSKPKVVYSDTSMKLKHFSVGSLKQTN